MNEILGDLWGWLQNPNIRDALRAFAIIAVGLLVGRFVRRRISRGFRGQERLLASRISGGIIYGIAGAWALSELGLRLSVLLGAAGVLTIAIGFAAQTAVSNLISGLFLIVERPFRVADVIEVGATTGEVVTIDLMSTKLRTFDNLLVRIPNEVLLKAEVKNLSHFPIRRIDVVLHLEHRCDLDKCQAIFDTVAASIPKCLDEPRPALQIEGFDDSGLRIKLAVWTSSGDYLDAKNALQKELTVAMANAEINFGIPSRRVVSAA